VTNQTTGRLYVVATPIGNLGDIGARAVEVLRACALIAAEDTRHTGVLLKHLGVGTRQISLHDHNERARAPELVARLREGADIALVSDAGTPAISDPGFELVRAAVAAGVPIVAIPGPCAAIAALSIGALPTDRFCFEGFLPARGAARRKRLDVLAREPRTVVLYESPHRIKDTLEDCAEVCGAERPAVIAREITKLHEQAYRGTLRDLAQLAAVDDHIARGEIVLLIAGLDAPDDETRDVAGAAEITLDRALEILMAELPLKQAARLAAQLTGSRDNEAYKRALHLKKE
jgi:16S rRNA (cytidine1402-2'-O)-methyltransferase